jgi:hypothetical protein
MRVDEQPPRARGRRVGARAALSVVVCAACLARADPAPDCPLGVGTPGTFRGLFLDMVLSDARPAAAPSGELRLAMANQWSTLTRLERGGRVVELQHDEQADVLSLALAAPWSLVWPEVRWAGRLESAVEWRLLRHGGGFTDSPIEAWHHLIGSNNFARAQHPRDGVNLVLREPGGATLVELGAGRLALGDLVVRQKAVLLQATPGAPGQPAAWAVALRLDLKVPTGRLARAGGSQGLDAGVGLEGTAALASWLTGHGLLSLRRIAGLPGGFPLQPRRWQPGAELSLAARSGAFTFLLEDRLLGPLFEGGWQAVIASAQEMSPTASYSALRLHNQISGGVRWRAVTVYFSEDFTPGHASNGGPTWFYDSNAPDLVLGLSVAGGW